MTNTTIRMTPGKAAGLLGALLGATILWAQPALAQSSLQPISKVIKPAGIAKVGACVVNRSLALFPSGGIVFPTPLPQGVDTCGSGGILQAPKALPSKGGPVNSLAGFTEPFTIMNTGNLALAVGNVFVFGLDAGVQYSVIGCSNLSIAPGQSCSGLIEFCAFPFESSGSKNSTLFVNSNAPGSPHTLPISGSIAPGTPPPPAPIYTRSPNSVTFPVTPVGAASGPEVVTISNTGNAPLTVLNASTGPGFSVTGNTCGVLAGGSSCAISVTFNGSGAIATITSQLDILYSPGAGSTTDSVPLSVTTVAEPGVLIQAAGGPVITNPLYPDLEPGQSHPITLKFKNLSASTITLSSVNYITTPSGAFAIQNDLCTGSVIPTGNFCFVDVVFNAVLPFNTSIPYSDVIRFTDGVTNWDVTASGYIIPPYPELSITPSFHDFGTVVAPSSSACQDFLVQNYGSQTHSFFIVSPSPPFEATGCTPAGPEPACTATDIVSQTLAAGTGCKVSRRFTAAGDIFAIDYISIIDGNLWWGTPAFAELQGTGIAPGPRLAFVPGQALTFGAHPVGTPAPQQSVTLTNTGDAPLVFSGVLGPAPPFSMTENCMAASPLAIGNSCVIQVDFTAPGISAYGGGITVNSNAVNGASLIISLDGQGVAGPQASADFFPMSVSFGNQAINSSSGFVSIPFANTGSAPMSIADIQLVGTDAGEFTMSHDCPVGAGTLATNDCCTIQVRFQPVQPSATPVPRTASIDIQSNATVPIVSIPLTGTAVPPPSLTASPASVNFGDQVETTPSAPTTILVTNTGVTTVTLTTISPSGDFALAPPPPPPPVLAPLAGAKAGSKDGGSKAGKVMMGECLVGMVLLPGDSCQVKLIFTPATLGARSGVLAIAFTGGVGSPFVAPLQGTGVPPFFAGIATSGDVLDFGGVVVGVGSQRSLVVTSTGSGALAVTGVRTIQSIFSASTSCTTSQAPGTSCSVTVTCLPTALGKQEGDLYIDHNATGGFRYVKLLCEGAPTPVPKIELSVTGIAFGSATLGSSVASQRVTIRSVGSAPLTIRNVASLAPFSVTNTCPVSLAPGEFCFADVTYTANGPGRQLGELAVGSDDPARPNAFVDLSGIGCRPPSVQNNRRPGIVNLCAP